MKTRFTDLAALGIVVCLVAQAAAQGPSMEPPPGEKKILEVLQKKKLRFEFNDAPLPVVVDYLRRETGVNIVVDPEVVDRFEAEGRTVNLKLRDIQALDALEILLRFSDLRRLFKNGVLFITTPEGAWEMEETFLVFFDLSDLVQGRKDHPGEVRDLFKAYETPRSPVFSAEDWEESLSVEDVIAYVRDTVAPDTWDLGEKRVTSVGDQLAVWHTREVHREIRRRLAGIERQQGPEIGMTVKVLPVPGKTIDGLGGRVLLSEDEVRRLEAAAGALRHPAGAFRLTLYNNRRSSLASGRTFSFPAGVSGSEARRMTARDGVVVDVHPAYVRGDGVHCVVRFFTSRADAAPSGLARLPFLRCETSAHVPRRGAALLAAGSAPIGRGEAGGEILAVLARAEPGPWPAPATGPREEDAGNARLRRILSEKRLTLDFVDTPLREVTDWLASRAGINIVIKPRVYQEKSEDELLVALVVREIPLDQGLDLLLSLKGLAYTVECGMVLVTTDDDLLERGREAVFPVHDLLLRVPAFRRRPPAFLPAADEGFLAFPEAESDSADWTLETLSGMIQDNIKPDSWTPPNHVRCVQNHLVVRSNAEVLKRVEAFLTDLRAKRLVYVLVEGRVLSAPSGWMERLGLSGPALDAAACVRLEKALAAEDATVEERFRIVGRAGKRFCLSGGRQFTYVVDPEKDGDYDTAAALDGWSFEGRVTGGLLGKTLGLSASVYLSRYEPPDPPLSGPGELFETRTRWDCTVEDGGGVLLGAAGGGGRLLYLRVRRLPFRD